MRPTCHLSHVLNANSHSHDPPPANSQKTKKTFFSAWQFSIIYEPKLQILRPMFFNYFPLTLFLLSIMAPCLSVLLQQIDQHHHTTRLIKRMATLQPNLMIKSIYWLHENKQKERKERLLKHRLI